jgi:hypothetical protein
VQTIPRVAAVVFMSMPTYPEKPHRAAKAADLAAMMANTQADRLESCVVISS